MDWASNLFVVLLLLDISGTIFFLIGKLFWKHTEDDVAFLRFLTEATLWSYLVPFVYIILYLGKRLGTITTKSDYNLFYNTPLIRGLSKVLGCVWIGLFLALLFYKLYRRHEWVEKCKGNIPEEDDKIIQVFEDVCAGFEIGGEVSLCRNDSVRVPCITYYHGYVVILPLLEYTEKEAEIIFYHELCHYLNKDLYLKTIGCIALLLHVFNPAMHALVRGMDMLCERCCDRAASKKGENRFTMQEYFQVIFDSLVDDGRKERYQLFALAEGKTDYERRVEYMKRYRARGGLKRKTAVLLAACFLFGSSITSLAAGDEMTDAYRDLTQSTSVWDTIEESDVDPTDEEMAELLSRAWDIDPEKVIIMDDGIEPYGDSDSIFITWLVSPGYVYMSTGFNMEVGEDIDLTVLGVPRDVVFWTGIKDPKDIMHYVEGSDYVHTRYVVEIKGRHYFFVYNLSETADLDIKAYLNLYTPDPDEGEEEGDE